ncbi:uncharacterized protein VNE69_11021 [Vairimorpha necatrix]|uniref:Uncharacterized protein n=1 Tax=Vairimorpha necatrix TaxID=6039 RepID=A0AAX4JGC3_9MICR
MMRICYHVFIIFLVHGYQNLYDNINTIIMNKIEKRDYFEINSNKTYLRVFLRYDNYNQRLHGNIIIEMLNFEIREKTENIIVNCNKKPIPTIIEEFEEILILEYKKFNTDSIVLNYLTIDVESNPFFKNIIQQLNKRNEDIKNKVIERDIFYECIINDEDLCDRMFKKRQIQGYDLDGSPFYKSFPLVYNKKDDLRHIHFCINLSETYYFFEINSEKIDKNILHSSIKFEAKYNNHYDKEISKLFHKLYKNVYFEYIDVRPQAQFEACSLTKINFSESGLMAEIKKDKVSIKQKNVCYVYSIKKFCTIQENQTIVDDKWISEFNKNFKKFFMINENAERRKGVDMFYKLMAWNYKIDFMVRRILDKQGTPLKILFAHLLLDKNIISESGFKEIVGNEKMSELAKRLLMTRLFYDLKNSKDALSTFAIKICIFIEAECYINENDYKHDHLYAVLQRIGNTMEIRKNPNSFVRTIKSTLFIEKCQIDLIKIFEEAVLYHLQDMKLFKTHLYDTMFKITSLFTLDENNECETIDKLLSITTYDVISNFKLNKTKVEGNTESILKTLSRKSLLEMRKKRKNLEYELKKNIKKINEKSLKTDEIRQLEEISIKIIEQINKTSIDPAVNRIKADAISKKIDNLYYEEINTKFANELINKGIEKIEKTFEENDLMKNLKNLNEDLINKYKTEAKERFCQEIRNYLEVNIRKSCKNDLEKLLLTSFSNKINNAEDQTDDFCKIDKVCAILSTSDILEILNVSGHKLHGLLIFILMQKYK